MRPCTLLAALLAVATPLSADEAADEAKAWQQRRLVEFTAYEIAEVQSAGEAELTLERTSLLSWSNPIRKTAAGAVFLWTLDGRPRLIASTYPVPSGIEQELTSLSERPLIARKDGQLLNRFPPGLEWKPVPNAEPPVASRTLRLTQMRRIAERFRVTGNRNAQSFDARMLTQPVYRSPAEASADVAVFAFVQGTDPEAIVLIEAVETAWRYGLARLTVVPISATLDDDRVWDLPECWSTRWSSNQTFRTIQLPEAR
jgi:hypothetical protein